MKHIRIIVSTSFNGNGERVAQSVISTNLQLVDLEDTNIISPQDGDALIYDAVTGLWENRPGGGVYVNTQQGVTALAGGGQPGSPAVTALEVFVDTVASANDSIQVLAAIKGNKQIIHNHGANSLNIFPINGGTDKFIGLAANAALQLDAGGTVAIVCCANGTYRYY